MSRYSAESLYELLPAVYRRRDADLGYPLRDLVELLAREAGIVEADIRRLYDNWFIETSDPWVVPYIGDLLGITGIAPTPDARFSRRAEVANTISYRRRKGTAAVLEQLARDVTGWPARVVEFFELLEWTQYMNHIRLHSPRTPDLRHTNALEWVDGPFDRAAHSAEVRRIAPRRGKYNIPNIGLFLWRLTAYPARLVQPWRVSDTDPHYTFSVLGNDAPLFTHPLTETSPSHIAQEENVPTPIRRRGLHYALEEPEPTYYGADLSLAVFDQQVDGVWQAVERDQVVACDLSDWNRPLPAARVAIDPVLGRLAFGAGAEPAGEIRVTSYYGLSDDLGGGQYERQASFTEIEGESTLEVGEDAAFSSLGAALAAWGGVGSAVIEVRDSRIYEEALVINLAPETRLEIRAANDQRPALLLTGDFTVQGGVGSGFELNGLVVANHPQRSNGDLPLLVVSGEIAGLDLRHTTLVPGRRLTASGAAVEPGLPVLVADAAGARIRIERSIVGTLSVARGAEVTVTDSILDANGLEDPAYGGLAGSDEPGGALSLSQVTVIGTVDAREMPLAENSIFLGVVTVERRQTGCVRFSHVPRGSRVPRRFRCQPDVAPETPEAQAAVEAARVFPVFTSLTYGDPGYCQLERCVAREIWRGAEDESEMGVYKSLRQPQREDGLRVRLEEYLRVGLEAGIFFVT